MELQHAHGIIFNSVTKNLRHADYKRVCELAKLYKQLITGEDIDSLLRQFTRREDDALFTQRKALTQVITPSVASSIRQPFYKVGRVNNIITKINFKGTEDDTNRKEKIDTAILEYYGNLSLDGFMRGRFVDLSFTDPNAFIVTEFDNPERGANGELLAIPKPRPLEVSSEQAVNFEYENNQLKWLLVEMVGKDGLDYTLYFETHAIKYTQLKYDEDKFKALEIGKAVEVNNGQFSFVLVRVDDKRVFVVEEFTHASSVIPAIRIGYKQDLVTNGRTFVNPFHDALPYFMKSIKTVSEFDLTMCLHAFPQKFQYVARCEAEGCSGGKNLEGVECGTCKGTGVSIHTSTQDAVVLRMPDDKQDMLNLEQMVHYEYPPIDLIKFQNDYIQQLKNEVRQSVFNSEIFNQSQVVATATEMRISLDSVYDTLFPFTEKESEVYRHIVKVSAEYLDIKDVVVIRQFPKDFKFKTLTDLLAELKLASDSNAAGFVRRELSADIAQAQFIDKPEELKRIMTKEKFYPFPDKTTNEILYIISNNLTNQFNKVLYANFDNIFNELEEDAMVKNEYFYDYAFTKQRELLKLKVDALVANIDSGDLATGFGATTEDINVNNDADANQ